MKIEDDMPISTFPKVVQRVLLNTRYCAAYRRWKKKAYPDVTEAPVFSEEEKRHHAQNRNGKNPPPNVPADKIYETHCEAFK